MRSKLLLVAAVLVSTMVISSACFTVDRADYVYVTQFGAPRAIFDGEKDAGLHWKLPWPIQSVQRLDRRLQVFDLPGAELLTRDPQGKTIDRTLTISAYVCWQIAGEQGVEHFIRTVGTPERAVAMLGQQISARLGAAISNMRLEELISVAGGKEAEMRMDKLSQALLELASDGAPGLRASARSDYGIELVDIRLRRFNYPPQVREEIFSRIRSERQMQVVKYQSEGAELAKNIESQAESEASKTMTDARAAEQRLKGKADADADWIRSQAQSKDVAFYAFLKKLAAYERILGDNKTVLLLSSHRDLFDLLFKPPTPNNGSLGSKTSGGPIPPKQPAKGGGS